MKPGPESPTLKRMEVDRFIDHTIQQKSKKNEVWLKTVLRSFLINSDYPDKALFCSEAKWQEVTKWNKPQHDYRIWLCRLLEALPGSEHTTNLSIEQLDEYQLMLVQDNAIEGKWLEPTALVQTAKGLSWKLYLPADASTKSLLILHSIMGESIITVGLDIPSKVVTSISPLNKRFHYLRPMIFESLNMLAILALSRFSSSKVSDARYEFRKWVIAMGEETATAYAAYEEAYVKTYLEVKKKLKKRPRPANVVGGQHCLLDKPIPPTSLPVEPKLQAARPGNRFFTRKTSILVLKD